MNRNRSAFDDRVMKDFITHNIKMVATTAPDGEPPQKLINSPSYKYVNDVQDKLSKVNDTIKQCHIVAKQVATPPPNDWLHSIGLTLADHFQKQLDDATLFLFSIFDKSLLLINSTLDLEINSRQCRYEVVTNRIRDKEDILKSLQKLKRVVKLLADLRHFYVHRGESRNMDLIELLGLIQSFEKRREVKPDQDVPLNTQKQILKTIRSEITKIEAVVEEIKGSLLSPYSKRLEELGGIIMPSQEELMEFKEVFESIISTEPMTLKIPPERLNTVH